MEMIQNFRKRSRVNTDMGKFFSSTEDTRKLIDDLKRLVVDIKDIEADILAIPIANDTRHQQLNSLYDKVKTCSSVIQTKLKAIEKGIKETEEKLNRDTQISIENHGEQVSVQNQGTGYIPVALRIRKTQHSSLLKQFLDIMTDYKLAQVNYQNKCKARLKRQLEITNSAYSEEDLEDMIERGNVTVFTKSIMIDTKIAQKNLEDIQARNKDLIKLEKSIREVAELFQELSQSVELQGVLVDSIEKNITTTQEYVDQGVKELKEALPKQRSLRKKKFVLLGIGVLIIIIIVVIIIIHI